MGKLLVLDDYRNSISQKQNKKVLAVEAYKRASELDDCDETLDQARELYEQALRLDPEHADACVNLGNVYYKLEDMQKALELYKRAVVLEPDNAEANYNVGYCFLHQGEHVTAIRFFERAIENDGEFADAYYNLAISLERIGCVSRSIHNFKKYVELEPDTTYAAHAREKYLVGEK